MCLGTDAVLILIGSVRLMCLDTDAVLALLMRLGVGILSSVRDRVGLLLGLVLVHFMSSVGNVA
uniref:Uncharacterized protein n=1 Tax=Lupinus angustifolius TaxID=3871 RepID=A0A182BFC1_LUPAN|nr:hypothetical protein [Lupinus angustifolius]